MIRFSVNIEPIGAVRTTTGRIRHIKSGKYDPDDIKNKSIIRYLNYKETIAWEAKKHSPKKLMSGAIRVNRIRFYMPIPESWSLKKRLIHSSENIPHTVKPDIDNLEKGVFDSLKGIIWKDDARVFSVKDKEKYYSEHPRVEIEIEEVEHESSKTVRTAKSAR